MNAVTRMDDYVGQTIRFQWSHRQPDLTGGASADSWNSAARAKVVAADRGALLLEIPYQRPRWWPMRSFAWIEQDQQAQAD